MQGSGPTYPGLAGKVAFSNLVVRAPDPQSALDEPQGYWSSVPPVEESTGEPAYIRLHARNTDTWDKQGITANERFNYWYTAEGFQEWEHGVRRLEEDVQAVYLPYI